MGVIKVPAGNYLLLDCHVKKQQGQGYLKITRNNLNCLLKTVPNNISSLLAEYFLGRLQLIKHEPSLKCHCRLHI